jgi:hypothetical protein
MTEQDQRRHQTPDERTLHEESAQPERTVDELEQRLLGRPHDQVRDEPKDETAGAEPP